MPTTVADALTEALPYVRRWRDRTVVVKLGGAAMTSAELTASTLQDLVLLQTIGVRVVLCHGGGPAVTDWGRRLGLEARFVDGLRVTDPETMRVAQLVQVGGISRDLVAGLARHGGRALGISGQDGGGWLRGTLRAHRSRETGEAVDLGRVGDITKVDADFLRTLLAAGLIPVVAPVAVDDALDALNVNADTVADAVAGALGADRLLLLTDVPGVRGPEGTVTPTADAALLQGWIQAGVVSGGMIPKVEAALAALASGVGGVVIADGRTPHAVLLELLTHSGAGTLITSEP